MDNINRNRAVKVLLQLGIPTKRMEYSLTNFKDRVIIDRSQSKGFDVFPGEKQDDLLSAVIFNCIIL